MAANPAAPPRTVALLVEDARLAAIALDHLAAEWRREARARSTSGPHLAEHRAQLRQAANAAAQAAERVRRLSGGLVVV